MAIPYTQPSMALVRAVDGTFISYPFIESGDTSTKVYNLVCTQRASDYNAAQIALDDNMGSANNAGVIDLPSGWADSNAYFVGDTGHAPIGGGMISFTRTFANIPQSTTIASGSENVNFPGINVAITVEDSADIIGVTMSPSERGVTIGFSGMAPRNINDNVHVIFSFTVGSDPFIHVITGNYRVLAAANSTVRIDIGQYWSSQVALNLVDSPGRIIPANIGRGEISRNVSTLKRYDYILPGVTPGISNILDINMPSPFGVINPYDGSPAVYASDGQTGQVVILPTVPSATEYISFIEEEKNIIKESSLSVWAGNILVQKTITCKAK
jgi:hypothetical protein